MNVAIQPCGDSVAQKHYSDTIANPVPKTKIVPFLTPSQLNQYDAACGEESAVWGVTPGKRGQNEAKWSHLVPGDVALLYHDKRIFSTGKIVLTMRNEALAASLWSRTEDGATWEYIYFLDELREIDIPVSKYNEALGYKPNYIVQGFNVHREPQSEIVLSLLGLGIEEAYQEPQETSAEALKTQLAALDQTDIPAAAKARNEQGILRAFLFGKKSTGACDLSGRDFPVSFLIAAHIKRRESCTDAERKCLDVVMRACRFGCDELFERGYICVDARGEIQPGPNYEKSTSDLKRVAGDLLGRHTPAFTTNTAPFFKWHSDHLPRSLKVK